MQCKVVGITKSLVDGIETPEEFISYVARVSNPSNQHNTLTAPKLLKYLMKHKHWSPFEMVNVVMEIESTRDIIRQILRHRSFTFQEFSQRYADPTEEMDFAFRELRFQDPYNRQNSIKLTPKEIEKDFMTYSILEEEWFAKQKAIAETAEDFYKWAIKNNIAKEQARSFLPEGLMQSRIYMNGTLRSWIHFCVVRTANGTQYETADIAKVVWKLLQNEFKFLYEVKLEDV